VEPPQPRLRDLECLERGSFSVLEIAFFDGDYGADSHRTGEIFRSRKTVLYLCRNWVHDSFVIRTTQMFQYGWCILHFVCARLDTSTRPGRDRDRAVSSASEYKSANPVGSILHLLP
jgi:hypothetical protein